MTFTILQLAIILFAIAVVSALLAYRVSRRTVHDHLLNRLSASIYADALIATSALIAFLSSLLCLFLTYKYLMTFVVIQ